jgi:hypothetical protein
LKHYTGFTLGDNDQIQLAGRFQNPETVMTISSSPIDDVPELFSTQEEAETRIILHALFANKKNIVQKLPRTHCNQILGHRRISTLLALLSTDVEH